MPNWRETRAPHYIELVRRPARLLPETGRCRAVIGQPLPAAGAANHEGLRPPAVARARRSAGPSESLDDDYLLVGNRSIEGAITGDPAPDAPEV